MKEWNEGENLMIIIRNLINEELHMMKDQVHNSMTLKEQVGTRPRSFIIQFLNYKMNQRVLSTSWLKKERIYFNQDYLASIQKERAKCKPVPRNLHKLQIKIAEKIA